MNLADIRMDLSIRLAKCPFLCMIGDGGCRPNYIRSAKAGGHIAGQYRRFTTSTLRQPVANTGDISTQVRARATWASTEQTIDDQSWVACAHRRLNFWPDGQWYSRSTATLTVTLCRSTSLDEMCGQQADVDTILGQTEGGSEAVTAIVARSTKNPNGTATTIEALQHTNRLSSQSLASRLHQIRDVDTKGRCIVVEHADLRPMHTPSSGLTAPSIGFHSEARIVPRPSGLRQMRGVPSHQRHRPQRRRGRHHRQGASRYQHLRQRPRERCDTRAETRRGD